MKNIRQFVTAAVSAAALLASSSAYAQTVDWRLHADQPATFWWTTALERFAGNVSEASGGDIEISVFPSSSLGVPADAILDPVANGNIELAEFVASYVAGEAPYLTVVGLPMIAASAPEAREIANELRPAQEQLLSERYGLRILATLASTPLQLYLGNRDFEGVESLSGLRIRTLGPDQDQFVESLEAFPTNIPVGELSTAMASNQVDGIIAGIPLIMTQNLVDFGPNIVVWDAIQSPGFLVVGESRWNELDADQQAALIEQAQAFEDEVWRDAETQEAQYRIEAEAQGYTIVPISDEDRELLISGAQNVWGAWAERNGTESASLLDLVK